MKRLSVFLFSVLALVGAPASAFGGSSIETDEAVVAQKRIQAHKIPRGKECWMPVFPMKLVQYTAGVGGPITLDLNEIVKQVATRLPGIEAKLPAGDELINTVGLTAGLLRAPAHPYFLDFSDLAMGDAAITLLCDIWKVSPRKDRRSVERLDLQNNNLGILSKEAVLFIPVMLQGLRYLDLSNNKLTYATLQCLVKLCYETLNIEYLDISGNLISEEESLQLGFDAQQALKEREAYNLKHPERPARRDIKGALLFKSPCDPERFKKYLESGDALHITEDALEVRPAGGDQAHITELLAADDRLEDTLLKVLQKKFSQPAALIRSCKVQISSPAKATAAYKALLSLVKSNKDLRIHMLDISGSPIGQCVETIFDILQIFYLANTRHVIAQNCGILYEHLSAMCLTLNAKNSVLRHLDVRNNPVSREDLGIIKIFHKVDRGEPHLEITIDIDAAEGSSPSSKVQ